MNETQKTQRNLIDIILLSVSSALMIIGIHQTITLDFASSYWIFMASIGLFLYQQARKLKRKQESSKPKLNRRAKRFMEKNG